MSQSTMVKLITVVNQCFTCCIYHSANDDCMKGIFYLVSHYRQAKSLFVMSCHLFLCTQRSSCSIAVRKSCFRKVQCIHHSLDKKVVSSTRSDVTSCCWLQTKSKLFPDVSLHTLSMLSNFAITEMISGIVNFSVTNRYGMMSTMLLKCICHEVKNQHVTQILQCRTVHLATTYTIFKTCSKLSV